MRLTIALLGALIGGAAHAASAAQNSPAETRQALETLPGLSRVQSATDAAGTVTLSGALGKLTLNATLPAGGTDTLVLLADHDLPTPRWTAQSGGAVISLAGLTGSGLGADLDTARQLLGALSRAGGGPPPVLVGTGVGGLAVVLLLEQRAPVAGGLAVCAPVSGWADQVAHLTDFRVVYDYFTRTLAGTRLSGSSDPTDAATLPDAAATGASVAALFAGAFNIDRFKANLGQIGDVTRVRADDSAYRTLLDAYARELPRWRAAYGGFPYSNAGTYYQGSMDDDPMNVGVVRTQAAPGVAARLAPFTPTGRWDRPLLTVHGLSDPLYPEETESVLRSRAGASPLARQVVQNVGASGVQPCDLPDAAVLGAYHELQRWAQGGPSPEDRTLDSQP